MARACTVGDSQEGARRGCMPCPSSSDVAKTSGRTLLAPSDLAGGAADHHLKRSFALPAAASAARRATQPGAMCLRASCAKSYQDRSCFLDSTDGLLWTLSPPSVTTSRFLTGR